MAKVVGVGGIFFRSKDPKALASWYAQHLGLNVDESFGGVSFMPSGVPDGGYTIWAPFKQDNDYFGSPEQAYMINLMVDDVYGAIAQVKAAGAAIAGDIQDDEFGTFGWFIDPDGNKIELWKPKP